MSIGSAFRSLGSTYVLTNAALQMPAAGNNPNQQYRVRNLLSTVAYFTWGATSGVVSVVPAAGTPAANTIGMLGNSVETFSLDSTQWFIASAANAFEFTPGDGL